ncbi:DUF3889 domain-containing protein [Oceanobacillus damuensis]|uniref:DUF3889 domain-containing protein n=1 Tax=Oceanobacillus damuensis TaxID=937928 RepID=UPI000833D0A7|nr:DUF3889 domain-containing protein [Oceanobacillus damuensis]
MRNLLLVIVTILIIMAPYTGPIHLHENASAQEEGIPSYAKWGRLAVMETEKRYPGANIVDYLHIGKEELEESTVEKFKLWLNAGEKEFGVLINIEFKTETDEVIRITFEETDR